MDWNDLRYVLAISRGSGLAPAARALGVNPSSVYRRLEAAEQKLGVRLFERLRSGYRLTAHGEELAEAAARMENEVLAVERRVIGKDVRLHGTVRISTSEVLLVHLLLDHLAAFRATYPGVILDFTLSHHHVDLSRRDADVVIRTTSAPPEHLVGRSVGRVDIASYATPAYLEEKGRGRPIVDYDWIGYEDHLSPLRTARWTTQNVPDSRIMLRFDSIGAIRATIGRGLGCGCLPCFVAEGDPSLERVAGTYEETDVKMWVLTHPDLRRSARIRACIQFFGTRLAGDAVKFVGAPAQRGQGEERVVSRRHLL